MNTGVDEKEDQHKARNLLKEAVKAFEISSEPVKGAYKGTLDQLKEMSQKHDYIGMRDCLRKVYRDADFKEVGRCTGRIHVLLILSIDLVTQVIKCKRLWLSCDDQYLWDTFYVV